MKLGRLMTAMGVVGVALVGCGGGGGVEATQVETQVKEILAEGELGPPSAVECPADLQPSSKPTCSVVRGDSSEEYTVTIDADGNATYAEQVSGGHID